MKTCILFQTCRTTKSPLPLSTRNVCTWWPCWEIRCWGLCLAACNRIPKDGGLNRAEAHFCPREKKSSGGQTRVALAISQSPGTLIPVLPGSSVDPGWLLELLSSHLQLSQPLKDLSWKPHPKQLLLTPHRPLHATDEAGKLSVLAEHFVAWNETGLFPLVTKKWGLATGWATSSPLYFH